jgi:hypothetical protein
LIYRHRDIVTLMQDARRNLYPLVLSAFAPTFLILFYWRALNAWFYQDDFGWLHLGLGPHPLAFSVQLLFAPKAHGNIRPWSENLFFWGLGRHFGVNPLPFHIVIFATVIASLFLLFVIVRKLTGSVAAAVGAQFFWIANPAFSPSLCWASIYNESQYVLFALLALWLFMNGRYWLQLIVFILSLGSQETAVMVPCILSLYAFLYDRPKLRSTLPLYLISAAFTALHFYAAPAVKTGPYAVRIDSRIFSTLKTYIEMALGPERLGHYHWTWPVSLITAGTALMLLGVIAAAIAAGRAGAFGAVWFLIFLVPFLVLPEHIFEYFLTGPAIGLAIILGAALASRWRTPAIALAAVYLLLALPAAWQTTTWYVERSMLGREFVQSVVAYYRAHPDKTLFLTGIDIDQFNSAFVDIPFELYGMQTVWLMPEAAAKIQDASYFAPLFVPGNLHELLNSGRAAVLDVSRNAGVRDVTPRP